MVAIAILVFLLIGACELDFSVEPTGRRTDYCFGIMIDTGSLTGCYMLNSYYLRLSSVNSSRLQVVVFQCRSDLILSFPSDPVCVYI